MTIMISAGSRLAVAREASIGTRPEAFGGTGGSGSASPRFLGITNQTIELPDREIDVRSYRAFGQGRTIFRNEFGRNERRASIPFLPTSGEFFYYGMGSESVAGTPNVTHTLTNQSTGTPPSFALRADLLSDTNQNFRRTFLGCVVDSFSAGVGESGELQCSLDILAKDTVDHNADVTDANLTATAANLGGGFNKEPYMFYDVASNITIGGITYARVKSFNVSVNNSATPLYFIQSSSAQDPFTFVWGNASFDVTMEIVPAGHLSGDTDSIYHLLEPTTDALVDITIPLSRGVNDTITFTLDDCVIRAAPHPFGEAGNEVTTSVSVVPENITITSIDTITQYSAA